MKGFFYIGLILLFSSCGMFYHNDLKSMEAAVRQQIKENDKQNKIHTEIVSLKALSYEEVPESEREQANDVYRCKLYLAAKWSYLTGGNRIYNVNDTLIYYFDSNKTLFRREKK